MCLVLQGIYGLKDAKEARIQFLNWCAWGREVREQTGKLLEPMARTARISEGRGHLDGIQAHWTQELTTAFME